MMIMTFPSRRIKGKKFKFQEYLKDLMNNLQNTCFGSMIEKTLCSISLDICESLTISESAGDASDMM